MIRGQRAARLERGEPRLGRNNRIPALDILLYHGLARGYFPADAIWCHAEEGQTGEVSSLWFIESEEEPTRQLPACVSSVVVCCLDPLLRLSSQILPHRPGSGSWHSRCKGYPHNHGPTARRLARGRKNSINLGTRGQT